MKLHFHKKFQKYFRKLRPSEQRQTRKRLKLFIAFPFHPLLHNHPLKGDYADYRSINITGDVRAIFKQISELECLFVAVDTHSHLYE